MKKTLEIEEIKALFFDEKALKEPDYKLFRISTPKGRFYYTVDQLGDPQIYIGVTSMLSSLVPKAEGLIKWMCDIGYNESKAYATERAYYGTLFHSEAAYFLINKVYDLDIVNITVEDYINKNGVSKELISQWTEDLKMDMMAFCKFCFDVNLTPLAIEIMLVHPDGYAGTIDIVCEMDYTEKGYFGKVYKSGDNKGLPKETKQTRRIIAAIDMKTGRKGFHDEMSIQLESYKHLIEHNFPDLKIERIYNWHPKEWRTAPDYALKDQTNVVDRLKFEHLVGMAKIELMRKEHVYSNIIGTIELGKEPIGNIENMELKEYIKLRRNISVNQIIDVPIPDVFN